MNTLFSRLRWPTVLLAGVVAVQAHPGHDGHELTWDFRTGFLHPLSGWDHVLAMVAVGWWAAMLGGRARLAVPAVFVAVLGAAGAVGELAQPSPAFGQALAASVLVLGLLIASAKRLPLGLAAALVGIFAVFHGLAHGAEMPASAAALPYLAGFLTTSALLQLAGVLGSVASERLAPWALRVGGAVAAVAGVWLMVTG